MTAGPGMSAQAERATATATDADERRKRTSAPGSAGCCRQLDRGLSAGRIGYGDRDFAEVADERHRLAAEREGAVVLGVRPEDRVRDLVRQVAQQLRLQLGSEQLRLGLWPRRAAVPILVLRVGVGFKLG